MIAHFLPFVHCCLAPNSQFSINSGVLPLPLKNFRSTGCIFQKKLIEYN